LKKESTIFSDPNSINKLQTAIPAKQIRHSYFVKRISWMVFALGVVSLSTHIIGRKVGQNHKK